MATEEQRRAVARLLAQRENPNATRGNSSDKYWADAAIEAYEANASDVAVSALNLIATTYLTDTDGEAAYTFRQTARDALARHRQLASVSKKSCIAELEHQLEIKDRVIDSTMKMAESDVSVLVSELHQLKERNAELEGLLAGKLTSEAQEMGLYER